jgi:trimeric autotransporter adhesin
VTPPYTGFLSAALSAISPASLGTCTKFSPVFVAAGQACALTTSENPAGQSTGGVRWQFSGTLNPGASGAVSFRVRVSP